MRQTGRAGLRTPTIDYHPGDAYKALWELFNNLERMLRSAQRKYPPDQSRIYRLLEFQTRILFTLLPYERPKLKSIAPPPEPAPEPDFSKLTDQEIDEMIRIYTKLGLKDTGAAGIETPELHPTTNRRSASSSAPTRGRYAIPTTPDKPTSTDADDVRARDRAFAQSMKRQREFVKRDRELMKRDRMANGEVHRASTEATETRTILGGGSLFTSTFQPNSKGWPRTQR